MTSLWWRHTGEGMFIFSRTLCRGDVYTNREVLKKLSLLHNPLHPSWIKRRYCSCPIVQWTSQFRAYFCNTYQALCNLLGTGRGVVRAHLRPSGWWRAGLHNNGRQCVGTDAEETCITKMRSDTSDTPEGGGQRSCSEMMRCDSQAWSESPCPVPFENVWYAKANIWCVLGKCKPMNFSLHVISQTQGCSLKGSFPKTTGNFLLLKAEVQVEIFF